MQNQSSVSIVLVTWNGEHLLKEFMPSVVAQGYPNCEVIVVDNASTDNSVKFLRKVYPSVRIVENPRNDGTAEGSNVGARDAKGDYLFFVSNDMWLEADLIERLVAIMDGDASVGIATVKMRRIASDGRRLMEVDSVGANVDILGFPEARGIHEPDRGQYDTGPTDVFFSFGGAMLIRRPLFEKAGGYDPDFFTLTDDIDLSWRVRLLGYRVVAEPRAVLYHRVSATLDTPLFKRAFRRFLSERNTIRALLKNYSFVTLLWIVPLDIIVLGMEGLFFLVLAQWRMAACGPRAVWWNICRLKGTVCLRRKIQQSRVVPDSDIRSAMLSGLGKFRAFADYLRNRDSANWRGFFGKKRKPGCGPEIP